MMIPLEVLIVAQPPCQASLRVKMLCVYSVYSVYSVMLCVYSNPAAIHACRILVCLLVTSGSGCGVWLLSQRISTAAYSRPAV